MRFARLQQTELHVDGFSWMWAFVPHCMHRPKCQRCPICKTVLLSKVKELGQTANNSVSNVSVPSAAEESDEDEELSDGDDDEYDQLGDDQSETINIDTLIQRIHHWRRLESASHNLQNLVTYFRHKVCIKEVR